MIVYVRGAHAVVGIAWEAEGVAAYRRAHRLRQEEGLLHPGRRRLRDEEGERQIYSIRGRDGASNAVVTLLALQRLSHSIESIDHSVPPSASRVLVLQCTDYRRGDAQSSFERIFYGVLLEQERSLESSPAGVCTFSRVAGTYQ